MRWRIPICAASLSIPGAMRTRMRNAAFPGEDPQSLPPPEAIGPLMVDLARGDRKPTEMLVSFRADAA